MHRGEEAEPRVNRTVAFVEGGEDASTSSGCSAPSSQPTASSSYASSQPTASSSQTPAGAVPVPYVGESIPSTLAPGMILMNKYQVVEKLGEGGMGSVWLVNHLGLDEPRALKVISARIAGDSRVRARFEREARILAKLKHPGAVVVHDTGIVGETAYIEMECVQGESLRSFLRRVGRPPLSFVLRLMRGICDVLGVAHNRGIVHRDLKPENVMIQGDVQSGRCEVKVLDFGIAKIVQSGDSAEGSQTMHTEGLLGTPAYASPEQNAIDVIDGSRPPVDHRSDVYSLGVMLYEMLTGKLPFKGGNWQFLLVQHAASPPPPMKEVAPDVDVPPAVEALVMRCLEKSPDRRPSSAAEFYNELREAIGAELLTEPIEGLGGHATPFDVPLHHLTPHPHGTGQTISAHVTSAVAPPRPRRLRLVHLAAVPLALALAAAIALIAWPPGRTVEPTPPTPPPPVVVTTGPAEPAEPVITVAPPKPIEIVEPSPPPTGVSPEVVDYLATHYVGRPYTADLESGTTTLDGGFRWPRAVFRGSGGGREQLLLHGRVYLPKLARPEDASDVEGPLRLPRAVMIPNEGSPLVYRLILGGKFRMGDADPQNKESHPDHEVVLSTYYLQDKETTVAQFEAVRKRFGRDWGGLASYEAMLSQLGFPGDPEQGKYPVADAPRAACVEFARILGSRLPTEAQWEFAASSRGVRRPYVWKADDADRQDNSNVQALFRELPDPVGSFPNDRTLEGVYDMAGNVREWCRDEWKYYRVDRQVDPVIGVETKSTLYSIRGGSFATSANTAAVTYRASTGRYEYSADDRTPIPDVGFRTVLEVVEAGDLGRTAAPAGEKGPDR